MVGVVMGKQMVYICTCQQNRGGDAMTNRLDIEWIGKSYTDKIDNLSEALDVAQRYCEEHGYDLENLTRAENMFAEIAFANWHTIPDSWVLTVK